MKAKNKTSESEVYPGRGVVGSEETAEAAGVSGPKSYSVPGGGSAVKQSDGKVTITPGAVIPAPSSTLAKTEIEFKTIASEIVVKTIETGKVYLSLCQFIRANQVAPKQVTQWLLDLGFHKSKVSEINNVAKAPDAIFNQFQARMIGWRGVLQATRGTTRELAETCGKLSPGIAAEISAMEKELTHAGIADEESVDGMKSANPPQTDGEKLNAQIDAEEKRKAARKVALNRAIIRVLSLCRDLGIRDFKPGEANIGTGQKLKLVSAGKREPVMLNADGEPF